MSQDLSTAVTALHARLDAWHAAVEGVAAESDDDPSHALADPRLEAAQDSFYYSLSSFEAATLPVLGMIVLDDDPTEDETDQVLEDDFFVHFVVAVADGDSPDRLGDAFATVNNAGLAVTDRLMSEGFVVRSFTASRGELELDDADDEGAE